MQVNDFILDDFCWSFSRIGAFESCPLCFHYKYIKGFDDIAGCYAQYGLLFHDCLEKYALGELVEYELFSYYKDNYYKYVTEDFPPNRNKDIGQSYYEQGIDYFASFSGFGDREILGVENEYLYKIGDYNFKGYIDLECPDEIIDHKTKRKQHITRLTKRHDKSKYLTMIDGRFIKFEEFIQLYLYAIPYYNKYGKYPKYLSLNMARINDWYTVEFDMNRFNEAVKWAIDKIAEIYKAKDFPAGKGINSYWCDFSCGQRLNCDYSSAFMGNLEQDLGVFDI